jgi:purine-cytosine permease-like protein
MTDRTAARSVKSSTAASATDQTLAARLDALNEFDREPVADDRLKGAGSFIGLYAGEHVAGTEFVIGPLFVAHGVTASDLILGLLVGNLLAVLSWGLLCAPIATRTRLNLYWKLRKITGPNLLFAYNIVNALMFCFLAGAMISVAATAVGIPFDMDMPGLNDLYPTSPGWVITVLAVGGVVTVLAILGFEKIAFFSKVASPWMFLVFVACAFAVLPQLGVTSPGDFWSVANEKIWTGVPLAGQSKFTFWHVLFFAWFCNMAMHIGMADMTILRYARKWQYGFLSAFGMYLGHFVAWIASGILVALAMQLDGEVAPGPIAFLGAGVAGLFAVVVAGWTTANPTIYRAGLALQTITPDWKRWKMTLAVGGITTIAALFPALMMRLLDFVALYGLILMPMGAVIFADFWILPRLGLRQDYAAWRRILFSIPAAGAWSITLAACWAINAALGVEIFFLGLPGWFIATATYVALSYVQQRHMNVAHDSTLLGEADPNHQTRGSL